MSGNTIGKIFTVTTFGESHGPALGAVVDGCPPGIKLIREDLQTELDRRRPGQSSVTTSRNEQDYVEILSGVLENHSTGAPIGLLIRNQDADSTAYKDLKDIFRPGHADFGYWAKYGIRDWKGGGRSSGRETAARVAAGFIAKKVLQSFGVWIYAGTVAIGPIRAEQFLPEEIERNPVRCPDPEKAQAMEELIQQVKSEGDSIGGVIEVRGLGVPAGLGEPVFSKLDADLASALMGIGAVKGVEFGDGFETARRRGSENSDPFVSDGGKIHTKYNRAGGILGGISTGDPILIRVAVKPTSSISLEQETVDVRGESRKLESRGRHDPCICPRIVPVAEAMTALVLVDHLLRQRGQCGKVGI